MFRQTKKTNIIRRRFNEKQKEKEKKYGSIETIDFFDNETNKIISEVERKNNGQNKYENFYVVDLDKYDGFDRELMKRKLYSIYRHRFRKINFIQSKEYEVNSLIEKEYLPQLEKINTYINMLIIENIDLIDFNKNLRFLNKKNLINDLKNSFQMILNHTFSEHIGKNIMSEKLDKFDKLVSKTRNPNEALFVDFIDLSNISSHSAKDGQYLILYENAKI